MFTREFLKIYTTFFTCRKNLCAKVDRMAAQHVRTLHSSMKKM